MLIFNRSLLNYLRSPRSPSELAISCLLAPAEAHFTAARNYTFPSTLDSSKSYHLLRYRTNKRSRQTPLNALGDDLPGSLARMKTVRLFSKAVVPEHYSPQELETVESIKMLIEKRIRPVIQQDGGDVSFVSYDSSTGYVFVKLSGACVGCVQSDITLKHMIQGMLCHYLDEITAVYNVDEDNNIVTPGSNY